MEDLGNNKYYKWCLFGFILVVSVHLFYAAVTYRGIYMDGADYFLKLLNNFGDNSFLISFDKSHPRYFIWFLTQAPVIFANYVLAIHNKFALMMLYSFTQLSLPLILIFCQYKLSLRTKRLDLYFWSLFSYCVLMMPFSIWSMVETPATIILVFILMNYLVAKIDYTKLDTAIIFFIILGLSFSMECIIYIGPLLTLASFYYASRETSLGNIFIKCLIGIGSFLSAICLFVYTIIIPNQTKEVLRFASEGVDFLEFIFKLCSLISVIALIMLAIFFFRKEKMSVGSFCMIIGANILVFIQLLLTLDFSLRPVLEGHLRTIPFWFIPIIILGIVLFDFFKGKIDNIKFQNYFCIVLICGIFQSCWQILETYYWNKNIQYMQAELDKTDAPLYLASEHEAISSFYNNDYRRYIWHNVYPQTSILLSKTVKQKTLLLGYEKDAEEGNYSYRDKVYSVSDKPNTLCLPTEGKISFKNKYWDLLDVIKALEENNKKNNISDKN